MLDIEHLFENIIMTMNADGDLDKVEHHPVVQEMLTNVHATFDELVTIAQYVKCSYCTTCDNWRESP